MLLCAFVNKGADPGQTALDQGIRSKIQVFSRAIEQWLSWPDCSAVWIIHSLFAQNFFLLDVSDTTHTKA